MGSIIAVEPVGGVKGVRPVSNNVNEVSRTAYAAQNAAAASAADNDTTTGFSAILAETLEEELIRQTVTMTGSDSADSLMSSSFGSSGVEAMMLASAAGGGISDTELAVFMLYMMMQTVGDSSESAMLTNVMSLLLSQMTDRGSSGTSEAVSVPEGDGTVTPANAWIPSTPAVTNEPGERSAVALREVIGQFSVESASRYTPHKNGGGDTYCNIYVWDVTKALGCEIPHYVDPATGDAMTYGGAAGAVELDANGVCGWLSGYGGQNGWREITAEEAQSAANEGYPVVAAWENSGGVGHVQIVCPSENGEYDSLRGPAVTQSGSKNYSYTYQSNIYSGNAMAQVRYYVHD